MYRSGHTRAHALVYQRYNVILCVYNIKCVTTMTEDVRVEEKKPMSVFEKKNRFNERESGYVIAVYVQCACVRIYTVFGHVMMMTCI